MPRRPDLFAFARANIENVSERVIAEEAMPAAEPLKPPSDAKERAAWERRLKARRASIRLGIAELSQPLIIEHHACGNSGD